MVGLEFAWYSLIKGDIPFEQGDIFDSFPVIEPYRNIVFPEDSFSEVSIEAEVPFRHYRAILMTQSCDLVNPSEDDLVTLCTLQELREARTKEGKSLNNSDGWGKLIRGYFVSNHLINKCEIPNHEFGYQIIDLQRIISVPYGYLDSISKRNSERVRLNPPYREHLSQAFARQFMRVGLPNDLPRKFPSA